MLTSQKEPQSNLVSMSGSQHENWGESNTSAQTDSSTDMDTDDKNQTVIYFVFPGANFDYRLLCLSA